MDFINKLKGVNVKDVDAQVFIKAFAQHLKQTGKFKSPEVNLNTHSSHSYFITTI
jgi:ribosomal protein S19E (S16A)